MIKLGEICLITMGQSPDSATYNESGNGLPFFQGNADFGKINPTARIWCSEPKKIANPNDILISVRAPIGALNIADVKCCIGRGLASITVNDDKIIEKYIWYALESKVNKLISMGTGSTFKAIGKDVLCNLEIPLPSLEIQHQIATTLDKVTCTITLCNAILKKLDLLVKSRFVEMFGNFVFEKDRWNNCLVGDVAETIDPQPSHRTPPVEKDGIPYIGIAECNYHTRMIDFESARKVGNNVLQEHIARYDLHSGDFIIGKIGTIGKPFFIPVDRTYALSANTVLIQPDKTKIAPYYLFSIFQSEYMDRIIDAEKKSTSQPAFGIQKVRAIEIPLPPLDLQQQFAAFVEQTDKIEIYR